MKKILLSLICILLICGSAFAQEKAWRYKKHATDCTSLTGGKESDLCYQENTQEIFKCVPTSGDCDTPAEWKRAGGGAAGGNDTQIQFNDAGAFSGDSGLTFDKSSNNLSVAGTVSAGGSSAVALSNGITLDGGTASKLKVTGGDLIVESDKIGIGTTTPAHSLDITKVSSGGSVRSINVSQTGADIYNGTAFSGVDEDYDNIYEAIKFTAIATATAGAACVQLKTSATITNPVNSMTVRVFTDNAGVPGSLVAGSTTTFPKFGFLTTSYQDVCTDVNATLTSGVSYWLVLTKTAEPIGGVIRMNCAASGTGTHAFSANGTSWTTENSKDCYLYVHYKTPILFQGVGEVGGGISSTQKYGFSTFTSGANTALQGTSTQGSVGVLGQSNVGTGLFGRSPYYNSVQGETLSGMAFFANQTGSLIYSSNAPLAYFYRNATLGSYGLSGAVLRVESAVADTGDLIRVIKQNNPKFIIKSTGDEILNGTVNVVNTGSLGSEKVTNGTFTGNTTGWTVGTGWAYGTNNVNHAVGNTADLEQNVSVTAGKYYLVTSAVSTTSGQLNRTGSYTITLGDAVCGSWSDSLSYYPSVVNCIVKATGTGNLKFTPSTDCNATVDTVSVKEITDGDFNAIGTVTAGSATITGLVSCDTIDTDANGVLACGTDGGSGATWGSITGTLSAQTDLNTELGLKAPLDSPTFTTFLKLPNSANPTIDAAGKIAIDTSATTGSAIRFYGDATYTLPAYQRMSFTIEATTASSDYEIGSFPANITIRAIRVFQVGATNVVGGLQECDANGASCSAVDSDITATTTTATDDGSLTNPTIDANDQLQWLTSSVSGTNTRTVVTIYYTYDAVN